jgi:hypothetical protein
MGHLEECPALANAPIRYQMKNVLVPRFFLTFCLVDVPYISRGLPDGSVTVSVYGKKYQNSFSVFPLGMFLR